MDSRRGYSAISFCNPAYHRDLKSNRGIIKSHFLNLVAAGLCAGGQMLIDQLCSAGTPGGTNAFQCGIGLFQNFLETL
jgi:hypothetical protein